MDKLKLLGGIVIAVLVFGCSTPNTSGNGIELKSKLSRYMATGFKDAQRGWLTGETLEQVKASRNSARQVKGGGTVDKDLVPFGEKSDKLLEGTPGKVQQNQNNGNQKAVTKEVTKAFFRAIFLKAIINQKGENELNMGALDELETKLLTEGGNAFWNAYQALLKAKVDNPLDKFDPLVVNLANAMAELDITSLTSAKVKTPEGEAILQGLSQTLFASIKQLTENLRQPNGDSYWTPTNKVGQTATFVLTLLADPIFKPVKASVDAADTAIKAYGTAGKGQRLAKFNEAIEKVEALEMAVAGMKVPKKAVDAKKVKAATAMLPMIRLALDPVTEQLMFAVFFSINKANMKAVFDDLEASMKKFSAAEKGKGKEYRTFNANDEVGKALTQIKTFIQGLPDEQTMKKNSQPGPANQP